MKATVKIVTINPSAAQKLLDNLLPDQRPINRHHVGRLVNEMKSGNWRLSPDGLLKIKGQLGNGQHRMVAVIESKTTQKFLMFETDDNELYKIVDSGNKRSVSDVLQGEYAKEIASAARNVVLYDLDVLSINAGGNGGGGKEALKCTRSLVVEFAEGNRTALEGMASFCTHWANKQRIVPVAMSAAVGFIAKRDIPGCSEQVDQFIQNVYDGESQNDAARDYRERMIRSKVGSGRLPRWHVMALMIKSLRSYLNGTRMTVVRMSDGEAFPPVQMKYPGKIHAPDLQLWFEKAAEKAGFEPHIVGRGKANPCVALYGPGPENMVCKQCRLFKRKGGHAKAYFKCQLRGDTNGPGTDHRANWPTCGRFVKQ